MNRYTGAVDMVRLGRALGYGARHAAKTLQAVAEAAAAPGAGMPAQGSGAPPSDAAAATKSRRVPDVATVKGAGRSMWGPLAAFSGALWLRVTALFFALVAWAMVAGAWRLRGAVRAGGGPVQARHFWVFAVFGALFGYFAVSGFVRANARERRGLRG